MLTSLIAGGLVVLILIAVLNRSLFRPIERMRRATREMADGDLTTRLGWRRRDELGSLAQDFDHMAEALEISDGRLKGLAMEDPLTGLLNHRTFQERLRDEFARARRESRCVAVVALDIDHFKSVNDRWGHAVGDEALRLVAKAITSEIRPTDFCGRVGGDEFMVGLYGSTVEGAQRTLERLRSTMARQETGPGGQHVTMSAGIAEFPCHAGDQAEVMRLADGALYRAKQEGRDRHVVYSKEGHAPLSAEAATRQAEAAGLSNTVHALARAVDAKDGYTHLHSYRVAFYAVALGQALGMGPGELEGLRTAGVLHDVGKIGISDAILLKPGKLTDEEFDEMKRHSELGRDIIAGCGMETVGEWVGHLHERVDGLGYPAGLTGDEIPLQSRILAVADALEAMTSKRLYRPALPLEEALAELERGAGTQFDAHLASHLVALVRTGTLPLDADAPLFTDADLERGLEGLLRTEAGTA